MVIQDENGYLDDAAETAAWLRELVASLNGEATAIGVRLVDDDEMRRLNRRFRDRDGITDVLAFPGEESVEGDHVGDVVVSMPTARRQARELGHDGDRELRVLLLHGVLHCMGHDHEVDDGEMDRLERRLRRRWIDG